MGVQSWGMAGQLRTASNPSAARGRTRVVAVGLTLANPATILSFIAAFGALGLATPAMPPRWWLACF